MKTNLHDLAGSTDSDMHKLYHVYHLYADGDWGDGWHDHIRALSYGLDRNLHKFYVALIGQPDNRQHAKQFLPPYAEVIAEEDQGWEQTSLQWIYDNISSLDGYLLYCHSKGASRICQFSTPWRLTMTYNLVVHWQSCLSFLYDYDTVGVWWHDSDSSSGYAGFYAGNFWWATTDYLKTLSPPRRANRFESEVWLGSNPEIKAKKIKNEIFDGKRYAFNELVALKHLATVAAESLEIKKDDQYYYKYRNTH